MIERLPLLPEEAANKVAGEIKEAGGEALVVKNDISDYEQVQVMAKTVNDHFGKIDVLINNTAWDKIQPFMDTALIFDTD